MSLEMVENGTRVAKHPLRPDDIAVDQLSDSYIDYYKKIFDKHDRDHDGLLNLQELCAYVESREYEGDFPVKVLPKFFQKLESEPNGHLDFCELLHMGMRRKQVKRFVEPLLRRYVKCVVVPRRQLTGRGRFIRPPTSGAWGEEVTVPDGAYEEEYSCYPPAVGMIILSLIIVLFFCIDEAMVYASTQSVTGPVGTLFVYDPYRRHELWRFFTYMFVHVGAFHLVVNLLVQIMLGIPLEMVHRWWRVLIVYLAGVLAGSLGTSITDPYVKLAGASGGVYALITAHISTIILNWSEMSFPAVQLLIFMVITVSDVSTAIYHRYVLNLDEHIGYTAHFAGALAGLLVGFNVLRNLRVTRTERFLWWGAMVLFCSLMGVGIILNVVWGQYTPPTRHHT